MNIKEGLKQGKKYATKEMIKNNDYIYLRSNSSVVVRAWGGNEQVLGDKYFSCTRLEWKEVK